MSKTNEQKGFSIIEVVLVLAIAGLIFLMVFIALPALQRNQRDSAKKTEVGAVVSAIGTYSGNNNGLLPSSDATGARRIAGIISGKTSSNVLESGTVVRVVAHNVNPFNKAGETAGSGASVGTGNNVGLDEIVVVIRGKCPAESLSSITLQAGTRRQAAVIANLESGVLYCEDA